MTAATTPDAPPRFRPAPPSWKRLALLASILMLGWAVLVPVGHHPQWWHLAPALILIVAFLGSWHGLHMSTGLRRWFPMTWRNRRSARRHRSQPTEQQPAAPEPDAESATIVIHLLPHVHAMTTPADNPDQLPWKLVTDWLNRYGIIADAITACSVTRMPPPSGLRSDVAQVVTARTPQNRDTWLSVTLRADTNVAALTAGREKRAGDKHRDRTEPRRTPIAELASLTAQRLIGELREQGWTATLRDDVTALPSFVDRSATVRRECWTGTEYSDGFRAVYAVNPEALGTVLSRLPALTTKATWTAVTVRSQGARPATIEACVGLLTSARPKRHIVTGMAGLHGQHRSIAELLDATGLRYDGLPRTLLPAIDLADLSWLTTEFGPPLGVDHDGRPVYLGLTSPEHVRIAVTGEPAFHVGIASRLALSGLPISIYTAPTPRRDWMLLANRAAPQQVSLAPPQPPPGSIIVTDAGIKSAPAGPISVVLRLPTPEKPPAATIVITQNPRFPSWFDVSTSDGQHRQVNAQLSGQR